MKKIILLLIISFIFVSCGKRTPSNYFPLKIGNKWEYNVVFTSGTTNQASKMIYTVIDTVSSGADRYFKVKAEFTSPSGTNASEEYYKETADGIVLGNPTVQGQKELVILPTGLETGKEWEITIPEGKRKYKITAFEDLTIGDKTYKDCIRIDYDDDIAGKKNTGFFYFAKKTGLIKFVVKNDMGNGAFSTSEANLTSFSE